MKHIVGRSAAFRSRPVQLSNRMCDSIGAGTYNAHI